MEDIKFTVPAVPVAQPRARARTGPTGYPQLYEAPKEHPVHSFKACCRMAAREAYGGPPIDGPLCVTALFILPRPKSMVWKKRDMLREPKATGQDLDNMIKALQDALNGTLWRDDKQIYRINATKVIAAGCEQPHVEVTVWQETGSR